MKPLEYVNPDLFNLCNRARPDGAFWIIISFYLLHVVSGTSERDLDLTFSIQQKQVLRGTDTPYIRPMRVRRIFAAPLQSALIQYPSLQRYNPRSIRRSENTGRVVSFPYTGITSPAVQSAFEV